MRKLMPRDAGGSFEVQEGSGPIRAMVSTGELLEIYKSDKTFRVETPETIDPDRTNPNAPFVVTLSHDVGTSNQIVTRVLLQADHILTANFLGPQEKKHAILRQLHGCKEHLLRCEAVMHRLRNKVNDLRGKSHQTDTGSSQVINTLPQVANLDEDCGTFLLEANRAIRIISGLPALFITLRKADKNFDHLRDRLSKTIGTNEPITKLVAAAAPSITRLVDMRNFFEHPAHRKTIIRNFHVLPDRIVSPPAWQISGDKPIPILKDMLDAIDLLVCVTEELLINLVIYHGRQRFLFTVQAVPADKVDREFPIKYQVTAFFRPSNPPPASS